MQLPRPRHAEDVLQTDPLSLLGTVVVEIGRGDRAIRESLNFPRQIPTQVAAWHDPRGAVLVEGAVHLVEKIRISVVRLPLIQIETVDVVAPVAVPMSTVREVSRLQQDSQMLAIPVGVSRTQNLMDRVEQLRQLSVIDEGLLLDVEVADRLQALRLRARLFPCQIPRPIGSETKFPDQRCGQNLFENSVTEGVKILDVLIGEGEDMRCSQ